MTDLCFFFCLLAFLVCLFIVVVVVVVVGGRVLVHVSKTQTVFKSHKTLEIMASI